MLHIKKFISVPFPMNNPTLEKRIMDNALIFDIETTGLNPHKNQIILIGFIRFDKKNRLCLNQLFIDDPSEEKEMLSIFHRIASSSGFFITYNGNSFDLPFLNTRMKKYSDISKLDPFYNIDLMRLLKSDHFDLPLKDYKMKTVEKYMGISRNDEISGKESVDLYKNYLTDKDPLKKEKILLHNADDIINLFNLLKVLDLSSNTDCFFDFSNEITIGSISFRIKNFKIHGDFICSSGSCNNKPEHDYFYNYNLFSFELDSKSGFFNLRIPVIKRSINDNSYSIVDINSLNFASECMKSFISENPKQTILSINGIVEKSNFINLAAAILKNIFKP